MGTYVNRNVLALGMLVLLGVAAISLGAATLSETTDAGVTDSLPDNIAGIDTNGSGTNQTLGNGTGPGGNGTQNPNQGTFDPSRCVPALASTPGTLVYFGAFVAILYLIQRRYTLGVVFLGVYAILPVFLVVYFLSTDCATGGGPGLGSGGGPNPPPGITEPPVPVPDLPPALLLGAFAVLFIGAVAVLFRASGDQELDIEDEEESETTEAADIAAAVGEAADRLEQRNADVDNEVYRAWREMTRLLDMPSPESSTPGEFADAAIDLGIDEDDIGSLTRLFEEVRYGHADPEAREDRAIEVFRSIEDEYGRNAGSAPGSGSALDSDAGTDAEPGDASAGSDTADDSNGGGGPRSGTDGSPGDTDGGPAERDEDGEGER